MEPLHLSFFAQPFLEEPFREWKSSLLNLQGTTQPLIEWQESPLDVLFSRLENHWTDALVLPLENIPLALPDSLSITALLKRYPPGFSLVSPRQSSSSTLLLGLRSEARVGVFSSLQASQLAYFRPDIHPVLLNPMSPYLKENHLPLPDGWLMPGYWDKTLFFPSEDCTQIDILPKEMVPLAGQGALAVMTRKQDLTTRRLFKPFHQSSIAALTNVERKVAKILGASFENPIGVYAERDNSNNFHLFAAFTTNRGHLEFFQTSSSTSAGMPEKAAEAIGKKMAG